jgi:hypothetical protein
LDLKSPELKHLINAMLAAKGEAGIRVEVQGFTDGFGGVTVNLINKGESVPFIPLDQHYKSIRRALPTQISISPLSKPKPVKVSPLPQMLDRALAELRWRLIGKSNW